MISSNHRYINRIENLSKSDVRDIETVYNATLDFFHENHWCVFVCDGLLAEHYKEKDLSLSLLHQHKKMAYHAKVYSRPTFVWAWGLEEMADGRRQSRERDGANGGR